MEKKDIPYKDWEFIQWTQKDEGLAWMRYREGNKWWDATGVYSCGELVRIEDVELGVGTEL